MNSLVYFFVTLAALAVLFAFTHARIAALEGEVRRLRRRVDGEPVYGWAPARDYVELDHD